MRNEILFYLQRGGPLTFAELKQLVRLGANQVSGQARISYRGTEVFAGVSEPFARSVESLFALDGPCQLVQVRGAFGLKLRPAAVPAGAR